MTHPLTTREIADLLGWTRDDAYHLVRALIAADLAFDCGVRKPANGRGKGENVYDIADGLDKGLARIARQLQGL